MAEAVSTERPLQFEGGTAGQDRIGLPRRNVVSASASALGALHALGDPLIGINAVRRVHAFSRKADDIDDLRLLLLLVKAIGAVGRLGGAPMTVADRQLHMAGRAVELDSLEPGGDFVGRRLGIAFLGL